jgi:copper(I)-binding protein
MHKVGLAAAGVLALLSAGFGLAASATASAAPPPGVIIEEAYVVLGTQSEPAVGFLVIANDGGFDATLVSVSNRAGGAGLLISASGKVMVNGALIPIHSELYMTPGGVRLEFGRMAENVSVGDSVVLVARFLDGSEIELNALVLGPEQQVPDHHDFQHS